MWHPFLSFSPTALGWILPILLVFCAILFLRLESLGRRLKTGIAPQGMTSLEMSLTAEESQGIIESWDEQARHDAKQHLCVDYFFIPIYSTALAILGVIAAGWFATRGWTGMSKLAIGLAWGQWLAGLFDFAENSILLRVLDMYPTIPPGLPAWAGWLARIKFLLIALAVLCCAIGLVSSVT